MYTNRNFSNAVSSWNITPFTLITLQHHKETFIHHILTRSTSFTNLSFNSDIVGHDNNSGSKVK